MYLRPYHESAVDLNSVHTFSLGSYSSSKVDSDPAHLPDCRIPEAWQFVNIKDVSSASSDWKTAVTATAGLMSGKGMHSVAGMGPHSSDRVNVGSLENRSGKGGKR